MKTVVIGILPQDQIRARMLAIARGEIKPGPEEPKVWFTSMKSLAEVLSDDNRALLRVITQAQPGSIARLAEITGRKPSNLSRTLKTLSRYGIVEMHREKNQIRPVARATEFTIHAA
ncbi:MAG: transcriptional regulator [Candidatus Competibacteraceae bacterium]|nr:MAG: transcriptional regulator [Candidatus Competibacteraceae bacterium]